MTEEPPIRDVSLPKRSAYQKINIVVVLHVYPYFASSNLYKFLYFFIQEESKSSHKEENIELLVMPSTSQENSKATDMLVSNENLDENNTEDDSFTTQQLFSFAWQIAKGMVCFYYIIMVIDLIVWLKI